MTSTCNNAKLSLWWESKKWWNIGICKLNICLHTKSNITTFLLSSQPSIQSGRFQAATDEGIRSGRRIHCQGQKRDSRTWNIQCVINICVHGVHPFMHLISHLNCLANSSSHFILCKSIITWGQFLIFQHMTILHCTALAMVECEKSLLLQKTPHI